MVDYREHKIKEIHGTEVMAELLEPPLQLNQVPVDLYLYYVYVIVRSI